MTGQGQVRLAPNGQVIGTDLTVAMQIAAARGYDLAVVAELLPVAELGCIAASGAGQGGDRG
jgi:hypothetical protein